MSPYQAFIPLHPFGTFPQNDVIQWRCSFSPPRLRVRLPLPQRRKKKGVVKRRPTSIGLEFSEMRQSLAADWPTALSDVRNGGLRLAESLSFPPFLFFAAAVLTKSFALFSRFSGKSLFFFNFIIISSFSRPDGRLDRHRSRKNHVIFLRNWISLINFAYYELMGCVNKQKCL